MSLGIHDSPILARNEERPRLALWRLGVWVVSVVLLSDSVRADSTVVFNELMYHPVTNEAELEWVELYNQMTVDLDISNWVLTGGIEYRFSEGTIVEGGGFVVVAISPGALEAESGFSGALGPFDGRLDNSGEELELRDNNFRLMDRVSYRDRGRWPVAPDGSGLSLAKRAPGSASAPAVNWAASREMGGTPGEHNVSSEELGGTPAGIVSYWSFDEGDGNRVFDRVGQNDGTLGSAATWQPGLIGDGSLSFDNSRDAYVNLGAGVDNGFATTDGIAIEALVRLGWSGELDDQDHIFRKEDGNRRIVLALQHDGTTDNRDVAIDPPLQPVLSFGVNVGGSYSELDMPLDGQEGRPTLESLGDGNPHHLVATYDRTSGLKAIYIDGALAFSFTFPEGAPLESGGTATAYVGNMAGRAHPFNGVIDEFAFWERALSAKEVAAHTANVESGRDYFAEGKGEDPRASPRLAFNETSVSPGDSWLEIVNHGNQPVALEGLVLVASGTAGGEVELAARTLAPGDYLTLSPQDLGFGLVSGEKLFLYNPDRTVVVAAVLLEEGLRGRHPEATGTWLFPALPTPGAENIFEWHDEIVINEILYHHRPVLAQEPVFENVVIHPVDAEWRFDQSGADLGTAWREADFNDRDWASGRALFYNETSALPAEKNTPLELGPITYYFRTEFEFRGDLDTVDLRVRPVVDDGAIFYLNGVDVYRFQMPEGEVNASTLASRNTGNARFTGPFAIPTESLVEGRNVLAVEVHQGRADSNDVAFGVEVVEVRTVFPGANYAELPEEWLELYNRSNREANLSGWRFDNGIRYTFPDGTTLGPGEYLVVAGDAATLEAEYPDIRIVGDFEGRLSNRGDRLSLVDARGNPVDEVPYFDRGRWHGLADGLGASLELRDPRADNGQAEAWAASDESGKSEWRSYTYSGRAAQDFGPTQWNEFVFGLFQAGEVLLDDLSVVENPDTDSARELLQNGDLEQGERSWRFLGTHDRSRVVSDPENPDNMVLHLTATDTTEHMHNHVETTLVRGTRITNGREYRISFRAKWLAGSNQFNTRLYFNRLARTTILDVPYRNGTPGERNSRFEDNAGPTYSDFAHLPVLPATGEDVIVTVRAEDPDGVQACTVFWSADRNEWQSAPMAAAEGGLYQGAIPWQGNRVITFYVEGEDTRGAKSTFPGAGADGGALFTARDGQAPVGEVHTLRVLMAPDVTDYLYENTNRMSNDHLPATVVLDEAEVFYGASVRLRGSERGRPDESRTSFHIRFQPDRLFRGVQRSISLDRSGGWAGFLPRGTQDEIVIKHIANHAGRIPSMYDDIVHVIAPRRTHTGRAQLLMARFSSVYLDSQFQNGSDGTLYTYELIYYPTTTTDGNPESLKRPLPDNVLGTDHRNLGSDKEIYRWFYIIENNIRRDDFGDLMRFTNALGLNGAAMDAATRETMDVDQWLRAFAFYSLCGVGDTYMSGNLHNNMYYVRPSDRKVLVFPWDMDFAFVNSSSHAVIWTQHNLRKVLQLPRNSRGYYRHLLDIMETTFNRDYMSRWVQHYGELDRANFSGILSYIIQRESFVRRSIPREVPFAITTNGGEDLTVEEARVTVDGTAWIDVATLLILEHMEQEIEWPSVTQWRARLDVEPGENPLTFLAFGEDGDLLDRKSMVVTSTALPAQVFIRGDANLDGRINITDVVRILFHLFRGAPMSCEDAGDVDNDEALGVADAISLLEFLFQQGVPPAVPFFEAGVDPDGLDPLGCEQGLEV